MSIEALSFAFKADIKRSTTKFVLVAMANMAGSDLTCWPSIQYISDVTAQDRKTVLENIKRLIADGYISDTQERKGSTNQVIVYRINLLNNSTENGYVMTGETVPKTDSNSTVFPIEQYRFSLETVPFLGHGNQRKRKGNEKEPQKPVDHGSTHVHEETKKVFDFWREKMGSPKSVLDKKRVKLIETALKTYSFEDICKAISGCSKSKFHMGDNPQKSKYNGLELILRSADKTERFIEMDYELSNQDSSDFDWVTA